eukprot:3410901-Rhodomonas_salina.1
MTEAQRAEISLQPTPQQSPSVPLTLPLASPQAQQLGVGNDDQREGCLIASMRLSAGSQVTEAQQAGRNSLSAQQQL